MAVDTASKRFAMIGLAQPSVKHVIPAGSVGKPERATYLDMYNGITFQESVVVWTIQTEDSSSWSVQSEDSSTWSVQSEDSSTWTVQ